MEWLSDMIDLWIVCDAEQRFGATIRDRNTALANAMGLLKEKRIHQKLVSSAAKNLTLTTSISPIAFVLKDAFMIGTPEIRSKKLVQNVL